MVLRPVAFQGGHPELKVRWRYEDADKTVRVKLEQTQALDDQTPLFKLPTTLEITEDVGKTRVVSISIERRCRNSSSPPPVKPRMVADRSRGLADQGARLRKELR